MRVANVTASPNPLNALSLIVSFDATDVDSARVIYERAGLTLATPFARVANGRATVAVLGLDAETTYRVRLEAYGPGSTMPPDAIAGADASSLRGVRFSAAGQPSRGYTLVAPLAAPTDTVAYVIAFDSTGRLAWYREFANAGWTIEAKQQPNGHITVFVGRSYGWQPNAGSFLELTPAGDVVRSYAVAGGYYTDPHELLLSFQGSSVTAAHLIGYDIRSFDLTSVGGSPGARLAVHVLERQTADGAAGPRLGRRPVVLTR